MDGVSVPVQNKTAEEQPYIVVDSVSGPVQNKAAEEQPYSAIPSAVPAPGSTAALINQPPIYAVTPPPVQPAPPPQPKRRLSYRLVGFGLIVLSLLIGGAFAARNAANKAATSSQLDASQRFNNQTSPLATLAKDLSTATAATSQLTVNGQLKVSDSLALTPGNKPANPIAGQLYYDQAANQVGYYDGKGFVYMQGGPPVTNVNNYNSTTVNNYSTSSPVTNVTNNTTNVTNVSGGSTDSSAGTAGNLAMFTAANTLGNSILTQAGTSLTAGSVLSINTTTNNSTFGSTVGPAATKIQAGTGGVNLNTGSVASGASGDITIMSGDSATTAAGNVNIDTGSSIVSGTVVGTKDFESGLNAMAPAFGFNDTLSSSTAQAHGGTHSLQVTTGTGHGFFSLTETAVYSIPAVAGHSYRFSAWVRAGTTSRTINFKTDFSSTGFGGGGSTGTTQWGTGSDNSSGWTEFSGTLVAPAGTNWLGIWASSSASATGEVHYIDDITVTDLSSSPSVAAINIGATNAQSVTLGNANELGPTSVLGSGLTLNGGLGNTSLTGGAITIHGAGNSTLTSDGILTVTSSGSASWGINPSSFTGNSLTLHAGAAGGVNNGGNLLLQSGTAGLGAVNGSITVDAPGVDTVSGTIIDQRGFETGTQNMTVTSNATAAQSNIAVRSGSFSLSETSTAAGAWQVSQDQGSAGIPVTAGKQYYFSAYVRAAAVANEPVHAFITWLGQGTTTLNPVMESGGTWMHISGTATAPAGATQAYWNFYGNDAGGIVNLFDDLWVTDLSTSTSLSSLNLGGSYIQSVTLGNQSQVGATTIQGGSGISVDASASTLALSGGTVNIVSPNDTGATGNISIHSGSSSGTASGNVSIDTGAGLVTGTIVETRGFESGTNAMTAWFGDTVAQSSAQAHSGTESLAETATGSFWGVIQDGNISTIPIVAGHHYFFSAWVRAATTPRLIGGHVDWGGGGAGGSLTLNNITDSNSGWTQMTASGVAPAGTTHAIWSFSGSGQVAGEVHYFDDLVTTDLSSSSAVSELDVGAANAQILTIGNMNEIGTTTINGGSGITMNSGASNFAISGGAITINGTAASSIGTSSGALTLRAGGGSGGGVIVVPQANTNTDFQGVNAGGGTSLFKADSVNSVVSVGVGSGATVGYTGVGASSGEGSGNNRIMAAKFTTTGGGNVTSMSGYGTGSAAPPHNNFQFALYTDSSGNPGTYIASSAVGTLGTAGWYTLPITATLAPTTTYWLVYDQNNNANDSNNGLAYNSPQAGGMAVTNSFTFGSGSNNGFPTAFPTAGEVVNANLMTSIYATFSTSNPAMVISANGLLTQSGPAVFQDPTNSPSAFQIQNSTGTALLTADTSAMTITVQAVIVAANLTVNGHIITGGSTPGIAAGPAACTTPTVTISGTDTSGTITVTTGTGCAAGGKLATITFATAFGASPHVTITPGGANAQTLGAYVDDATISTSTFDLSTVSTPADTTTYKFNYWSAQ